MTDRHRLFSFCCAVMLAVVVLFPEFEAEGAGRRKPRLIWLYCYLIYMLIRALTPVYIQLLLNYQSGLNHCFVFISWAKQTHHFLLLGNWIGHILDHTMVPNQHTSRTTFELLSMQDFPTWRDLSVSRLAFIPIHND